jgi:hypothetical protein
MDLLEPKPLAADFLGMGDRFFLTLELSSFDELPIK